MKQFTTILNGIAVWIALKQISIFPNRNVTKDNKSVDFRKMDAINLIKFIGRQHSFLSDIVDDLNYCYTYKVYSIPLSIDFYIDFWMHFSIFPNALRWWSSSDSHLCQCFSRCTAHFDTYFNMKYSFSSDFSCTLTSPYFF